MDVFKVFTDEIRNIVREEVESAFKHLIEDRVKDRWVDKKELAEHWGVSTKWIEVRIDEIPKSATIPWRFKIAEADEWRKGEIKKETSKASKVNTRNYNSNNFKII